MAQLIEPTDQQLREACARMALRFHWLGSFETVMQDPVRSRLVRVAAMHPTAACTPVRRPAPAPRHSFAQRRISPPLFDRKRAAAGERDDD